ncbi:MAG: hypothetical protein EOM03_05720 [Clostridia bacterium]|nr:hypothetical protein [Clostridia bacterium]
MKYNEQQQKAIQAEGNSIVSAGAGCGKTSVLVGRCLEKILDEKNPVSLQNILMITFMKDAAAEMKNRIREEINRRIDELRIEKKQGYINTIRRLESELVHLETASICTIHSFCLKLLREHFDLLSGLGLNLGSNPSALDASNTSILMKEAFTLVMKKHYSEDSRLRKEQKEGDPLVVFLREHLDNKEATLREMLFRIYNYTQSLAYPEEWIEKQKKLCEETYPNQWEQIFFGAGDEEQGEFLRFLALYGDDIWGENAPPEMRKTLTNAFRHPNRENQITLLREFVRATKKGSGCLNTGIKKFRDKIIEILDCFGLVPNPPDPPKKSKLPKTPELPFDWSEAQKELTSRWDETRWVTILLLKLLEEFQAEFKRQKEFQNGLTFSDQLQFTLRLLRDPKTKKPTPIAESLRENYHFIFVDEFQDTDSVQDALISAVAGNNRFIVGDVKQSIYRFRLANPRVFREYEEKAHGSSEDWTYYPLNKNYRSQADILDFANVFFRDLMKKQVGSVEFGEHSKLEACAPAVASETPRVQIIWNIKEKKVSSKADDDDESSEEDLDDTEKEAILVAEKLLKLKETLKIRVDSHKGETNPDSPQTRPMEWSDVALLCRGGLNETAPIFIREFERRSIPIVAPGIPIFDCVEVMDLMNIIQLLDNPRQDIPLLGFLFSPFIRITKLEIIQLRTFYPRGYFWEAVDKATQDAAESKNSICVDYPGLAEKLLDYKNKYEDWRGRLRYLTISDLLEKIIDETAYEDCLYALPFPEQKIKNIRRFISLIRTFDTSGSQSIPLFLKYIKDIRENNSSDYTSANSATGSNAVQIRTVHKSKGLEYPIVFLVGMSKKIRKASLEDGLGFNEADGIFLHARSLTPEGYPQRMDTLGVWSYKKKETRELIGEEMRILYVAMTRARDYLFLCLSAPAHESQIPEEPEKAEKTGKKSKAKNTPEVAVPFSAEGLLLGRVTYAEWFLGWLNQYISADEAKDVFAEGEKEITIQTDPPLKVMLQISSGVSQTKIEEEVIPEEILIDNYLKQLREKREKITPWVYPYESIVDIPCKNSVTSLKKISELRRGTDRNRCPMPSSDAMQEAAEKGSLFHKIMERLELRPEFTQTPPSSDFYRTQLEKMMAAGALSPKEAQTASEEMLPRVEQFWQSDIARAFLERWDRVEREVSFSILLKDEDLARVGFDSILTGTDESIVVQGVIDLLMLGKDEIWVLDYKTDQVDAKDCPEKALSHAPQINLYAFAMQAIYHLPVRRKYVAFVKPGRIIELN